MQLFSTFYRQNLHSGKYEAVLIIEDESDMEILKAFKIARSQTRFLKSNQLNTTRTREKENIKKFLIAFFHRQQMNYSNF